MNQGIPHSGPQRFGHAKTRQGLKAAFATWQDRIAPLFDTSRQVCILEILPGRPVIETYEDFQGKAPVEKVMCLVEGDVETLICGAISRSLQAIAAAHGIDVIPYIAGDLRDVARAWQEGRIHRPEFAMPGTMRPINP